MKNDSIRVVAFCQENTRSKPNEDWLHAWPDEGVFAVADGISRSRINGVYPAISSVQAATRFCSIATAALTHPKQSMYTAFLLANLAISEFNRLSGITAETVACNDYVACVGIAGRFSEENPRRFEYGYIGDCGILVYDANHFPKFLSENPIGILERFRERWGFPGKKEEMIFWRGLLRNRPDSSFMTYGALTGACTALAYLKTGCIDLAPGDTLILFSDGIYPFLFDRGFRGLIAQALGTDNEVQMRSSLIAYMDSIIPDMRAQGTGNLDDDKTFIALTLD